MKRFFRYISIVGLMLGLTYVSASAADQPKRGGTLTMAISNKMKMMNPLVRTSPVEKRIRDLMFEPLLVLDSKGKVHTQSSRVLGGLQGWQDLHLSAPGKA